VNKADDTPTTAPSDTPSDTPSDAPSGSPSDTPSDAPSDTPTDAPTDAPTTLGNITELKATKAAQLTATFDSDVPAETEIKVTKGSATIEGKSSIEGKTVTFDATANFIAGSYTLTAKLGDVTRSMDVEVKESYVAEIKVLNEVALTGKKNAGADDATAAYIYYDVLNQYGESVKTSESIEWTTAPDNKTIDKSLGKITVTKDDGFQYGSQIYITGVHVKSGQAYTGSVTVGMAQAVDSVEFSGFLNINDKTKKIDELPADFAKDTYYLLYKVADQNGNPLDASDEEFTHKNLTFISDSPLLLNVETKKHEVFTVGGEDYAAVLVQPGQYVDKGGEVNITAISNKTGGKTTQNYVIGTPGILKSVELSAPVSVVADGDEKVVIPFVAKDTEDREISNYETIVRSSNALSLSASDGRLWVEEQPDGTAVFKWTDDQDDYNPKSSTTYGGSDVADDMVRRISFTTVVVGGTSNNMMLEVSDIRRPSAIKTVTLNSDANNTLAATNSSSITINGDNKITFLDQYGAELDADKAAAFFEYAKDNTFGKGSDAGYYGIRADVTDTVENRHLGLSDKVYYGGNMSINVTGTDVSKAESDTVKYSIVKTKLAQPGTTYGEDAATIENVMSRWDDVSKIASVSYTVVPLDKLVSDATIQAFDKQELHTANSKNPNGSDETIVVSGSALVETNNFVDDKVTNGKNLKIVVKGKYQGAVVTIPNSAFTVASASAIAADSDSNPLKIASVNELKWGELYNFGAYGKPRIDAEKDLILAYVKDPQTTIKRSITFSDAESDYASISWVVNHTANVKTAQIWPDMTKIEAMPVNPHIDDPWWATHVVVTDQYGKAFQKASDNAHDNWGNCPNSGHGSNGDVEVEFTVSNIKENTGALAHKPNSFEVHKNGSSEMYISGAEIGDTYTLTATVKGTKISASIDVTVANDGKAYIDSDSEGTASKLEDGEWTMGTLDKGLRTFLGYDR